MKSILLTVMIMLLVGCSNAVERTDEPPVIEPPPTTTQPEPVLTWDTGTWGQQWQ